MAPPAGCNADDRVGPGGRNGTDFRFSGGFTASDGQPIFLGMSNTVYNGGSTSYGSGGNIFGGAIRLR